MASKVPARRPRASARASAPAASNGRRTQAQRRTETRGLLLEAALETLVASGLASFTTPEVCRRAGLSQGALFKHFTTKAELLAAVAEHLFSLLRDRYEASFFALPPRARTVQGGLALLWEQMTDPRLAAAFELYTAARTDADLQARLEPVVRAHLDRIEALSASLVDLGDPAQVKAATALAIAAMQGLVLNQMALPDAAQVALLRAHLDAIGGLLLSRPPSSRSKAHG